MGIFCEFIDRIETLHDFLQGLCTYFDEGHVTEKTL